MRNNLVIVILFHSAMSMIMNEVIEGKMNIESIYSRVRYTIDFSKDSSDEVYKMKIPKEYSIGDVECYMYDNVKGNAEGLPIRGNDNLEEQEVEIEVSEGGIMKCSMNIIGSSQRYEEYKEIEDKYKMKFHMPICPITEYSTSLCIMEYEMNIRNLINVSEEHRVQNNNFNIIKYTQSDYKYEDVGYVEAIFYSVNDPIRIREMKKTIRIKTEEIEVEERYYDIENEGEKNVNSFDLNEIERGGVYYKKIRIETMSSSIIRYECYDSAGLIRGCQYHQGAIEVELRYPLLGGWKSEVFIRYSYGNNNSNDIDIEMINRIDKVAIEKYEIDVEVPIGSSIEEYGLNKRVYPSRIGKEEYKYIFMRGERLKVKLYNIIPNENVLSLHIKYTQGYDYNGNILITIVLMIAITVFIIEVIYSI